jgi:hypothetical protein
MMKKYIFGVLKIPEFVAHGSAAPTPFQGESQNHSTLLQVV